MIYFLLTAQISEHELLKKARIRPLTIFEPSTFT